MSLNKFVPKTSSGGTRLGSHFIMTYWKCPSMWFNTYIRPHPTLGGAGCSPAKLKKPLHIGSTFHTGIEHYYLSGWKNGKYKIDEAIAAAEQFHLERKAEMVSMDEADASWIQTKRLLQRYDEHWGPGSNTYEYPYLRIAEDTNGAPLLEREFEIDLGYKDYVFTCKPDAIIHYGEYMAILEHKTTAASRLERVFDEMNMSIQLTGEMFVLQTLYPNMPIHSIVISAAVKDRSAKALKEGSKEFERRSFSRSKIDIDKFKIDILETLKEMDIALQKFQNMIDSDFTVDEAARLTFRMDRTQCVGSFSRCDYYQPCASLGHESTMFLSGYKPRSVEKLYVEQENPEY